MSDFVLALMTGLSIFGVLRLSRWLLLRSSSASVSRRLGALRQVEKAPKMLLAGPAERFGKTKPGALLQSYAARVHPGIPFSDVVALFFCGVLGGFLLARVLFVEGPLVWTTALTGPVIVDRLALKLAGRRAAKLETQMPEALLLQASALRAGNSLAGSLRVVAHETTGHLGRELALTVGEIEIGLPFESALESLSRRVASRDVDLWVTALLVHRMTGGNLATLLESLSERIRTRQHLAGEVRAMTAQARLSGIVIGAAPIVFFLFLSLTARQQMKVLFNSSLGLTLLITGLALEAAGFIWIRSLLRVRA